jgi:hypothetical protein
VSRGGCRAAHGTPDVIRESRERSRDNARIFEAQIHVDRTPYLAGQGALVRGGQVGQAVALRGRDLRAEDHLLPLSVPLGELISEASADKRGASSEPMGYAGLDARVEPRNHVVDGRLRAVVAFRPRDDPMISPTWIRGLHGDALF